ncbi:MAG TPA: hypothetical protein VIK22_05945 [Candidatus Anoxymicrobiaceae bacterium]
MNASGNSTILDREPKYDDISCSLAAVPRLPRNHLRETEEVVATARRFNERVVKPYALDLDRLKHEDPDYLASLLIRRLMAGLAHNGLC